MEKTVLTELNEWVTLADKYSTSLEEFDLVCFFCAQPFETDLINSTCPFNEKISKEIPNIPDNKIEEFRKQINDNETLFHSTNQIHGLGQKLKKLKNKNEVQVSHKDIQGFTKLRPPEIFFGNER